MSKSKSKKERKTEMVFARVTQLEKDKLDKIAARESKKAKRKIPASEVMRGLIQKAS